MNVYQLITITNLISKLSLDQVNYPPIRTKGAVKCYCAGVSSGTNTLCHLFVDSEGLGCAFCCGSPAMACCPSPQHQPGRTGPSPEPETEGGTQRL